MRVVCVLDFFFTLQFFFNLSFNIFKTFCKATTVFFSGPLIFLFNFFLIIFFFFSYHLVTQQYHHFYVILFFYWYVFITLLFIGSYSLTYFCSLVTFLYNFLFYCFFLDAANFFHFFFFFLRYYFSIDSAVYRYL